MGAVSRLCERCLLLDQGRLVASGPTNKIIQAYMSEGLAHRAEYLQPANPNKAVNLRSISLTDAEGLVRPEVGYDESPRFTLEYEVNRAVTGVSVGVAVFTSDGTCAFATADFDAEPELLTQRHPGTYRAQVVIPSQWLNIGMYSLSVHVAN